MLPSSVALTNNDNMTRRRINSCFDEFVSSTLLTMSTNYCNPSIYWYWPKAYRWVLHQSSSPWIHCSSSLSHQQLCHIDCQAEGGIPSYSFALMVIFFLQQRKEPILPVYLGRWVRRVKPAQLYWWNDEPAQNVLIHCCRGVTDLFKPESFLMVIWMA